MVNGDFITGWLYQEELKPAVELDANGTASHTNTFTIRDFLKLRKKIIQKFF